LRHRFDNPWIASGLKSENPLFLIAHNLADQVSHLFRASCTNLQTPIEWSFSARCAKVMPMLPWPFADVRAQGLRFDGRYALSNRIDHR
jgi:hypothetical protein